MAFTISAAWITWSVQFEKTGSSGPSGMYGTGGDEEESLPPLVKLHQDWNIEVPSEELQRPELIECKEVYAIEYGTENAHMNFIGVRQNEKLGEAPEAHCIVSILKKPQQPFPKAGQVTAPGQNCVIVFVVFPFCLVSLSFWNSKASSF